ncbi:protein FDD123-like protein 2 [Diplogelasinospora grovesii]|uniref:Protein FDD123-like protein 2 n=1 Tax=Diplogelasinospora grovesii TaxID=303347 RepID=A0AAN6MWL5_9PEZI|nr:protein FDD123-like protein 2 [Diplogelasinospora grovesii]
MSGNQALNVNSNVFRQANLAITNRGSDWYFTVCAIMGASTLTFVALALTKPRAHRIFHYITAGITFVACIAYFTMGSNLGQVPIQAEFVRPYSSQVFAAGTREIFYVRYIDWVITTPLLLLDLTLTAGLPAQSILITIFADEIMIVCGLVGALIQTTYKWAYWTFGMFALFFVTYMLCWEGRHSAAALGGDVHRTYLTCGVILLFMWFLYPIAWGLAEGGNVIHPDSEAIFYGILDIISKVLFGSLLIYGHSKIDPAVLGMHIRDPGDPPKPSVAGVSNGVSNGHTMVENGHGHHANGNPAAYPATSTAPGMTPA